jgi:dihydrodipicolinate synthase/N-acetylneuraminate lyase
MDELTRPASEPSAVPSGPQVRYKRTVLATCCVPWSGPWVLDEALFRRSINGLVQLGHRDLYLFGTAGEGHAVDDMLFRKIADVFLEELDGTDVTPMIGVISTSIATMRDRIRYCLARGCRSFQFALAGWSNVGPPELLALFREVCGSFPEAAFIHYNTPRSGRVVRPTEYRPLADALPNLVGTKYGAGDPEIVTGLMTQVPELRHFLTELGFYYGSAVGACGLLASISATNPRRAWQYLRCAEAGDLPGLRRLFTELAEMMTVLRAAVGPADLTDGAYDKIIAKVVEPDFPVTLLPPYLAGRPEAFQDYAGFLRQHRPQWLPQPSVDPPQADWRAASS